MDVLTDIGMSHRCTDAPKFSMTHGEQMEVSELSENLQTTLGMNATRYTHKRL